MTSLFDNDLIRKYFGCDCPDLRNAFGKYHLENCNEKSMALRILAAMQEPIKKGDKFLVIGAYEQIDELICDGTWATAPVHPSYLRLPQKFQQPPAEAEKCVDGQCCGKIQTCVCECHKPSVEEKCGDTHACEHGPAFHAKAPPAPSRVDKTCDCGCHLKGYSDHVCCEAPPVSQGDAVEEKIKSIVGKMPVLANVQFLEDALRQLVAIARGEKA